VLLTRNKLWWSNLIIYSFKTQGSQFLFIILWNIRVKIQYTTCGLTCSNTTRTKQPLKIPTKNINVSNVYIHVQLYHDTIQHNGSYMSSRNCVSFRSIWVHSDFSLLKHCPEKSGKLWENMILEDVPNRSKWLLYEMCTISWKSQQYGEK
jgi:hypothetical protein